MRKISAVNQTDYNRRRASGFTLLELVIAFSMATIVFFATSMIMVFGQRSINRDLQRANLQREASLTMLKIKQSIRSATLATLDVDGNGVKIYHSAGWIRFWWLPGPKDLLYQLEGEDQHTLLDGTAQHVDFEVSGSAVTVNLTLLEDNYEARLATTTMMRNYAAGP